MRYLKTVLLSGLLYSLVAFAGCSPMQRGIETQSPPPTGIELLRTVKVILEGYVRGGERGEELENYDQIVTTLRSTHPNEADILEKGFAELQAAPDNAVKATAQKILGQLGEID